MLFNLYDYDPRKLAEAETFYEGKYFLKADLDDLTIEVVHDLRTCVPMREYNKHVLAYRLPSLPTKDELDDVVEKISDDLAEVWYGYYSDSDNDKAQFSKEAEAALHTLDAFFNHLEYDGYVVINAKDYLVASTLDEIRSRYEEGEEIESIVDGLNELAPVNTIVVGLNEAVEQYAKGLPL